MGCLIGLDVGDKRIGIAKSDGLGIIASPLSVYQRVGYGPDTRFLLALVNEHQADALVVGLPRNMDGSLGEQAQKTMGLIKVLEEAGLTVITHDERLSTRAATQALISGGKRRQDRKQLVDKVAAALILQSYLDMISNGV